MARRPLALTMGEPGGVGPEITLKAHEALRSSACVFFALADPSVFPADRVAVVSAPGDAAAAFARRLPVLDIGRAAQGRAGRADPASAPAVIASIEYAVALALSGAASGVVTNPIEKSSLSAAGFGWPGHTEFIEHLTRGAPMPGARARGAVMMIAGPSLRTVPVTIHRSVRDAAAELTAEAIVRKAVITIEALRADFAIVAPRLAISGLNPHAGEKGMMGREEIDVIAPAVAALRARYGAAVTGPRPADTLFHEEARARYDAALCMLHDQALIPAKTLSFHEAVNVTLGLPIVRTSPDHGTALDIAGKGAARADSLITAIKLAATLADARART
ncbi:MAG TPA: 4-hydroxythreonine-4-phosphate dehydrogenase PdxA [Parvularcula sp.]|nr:4-hydroxythreonine-4-phosphate dehydrogenase PdxA [Parvularcula sp.]HBS31076.1 4-hydroxythreonine-4-phosphate dehydrogenase PdxA [Parvularcula sp.]